MLGANSTSRAGTDMFPPMTTTAHTRPRSSVNWPKLRDRYRYLVPGAGIVNEIKQQLRVENVGAWPYCTYVVGIEPLLAEWSGLGPIVPPTHPLHPRRRVDGKN